MVVHKCVHILGAGLALLTVAAARVQGGTVQNIVFVSDRTGDKEIWRMDADGGGLAQLTFNPGLDAEPVPSPDGYWVAYISEAGNPPPAPGELPNTDIWIMRPDGSEARRLTFYETAYARQPAWSPDGSKIAFARAVWGAGNHLTEVPIDLSEPPYDLASGVPRYNPEYRPTGTHLLYDRDDVGAGWWSQWDMDLENRIERQLTSWHHSLGGAYSHDGNTIAYIRALRSVSQVRVMNWDGSGDELCWDNAAIAYDGWGQGTWSPDDSRIAVSIYPSLYPGVPEFDSFIQVLDAGTCDEIYRTSDGRNTFALESCLYGDRHFVGGNMVWNSDGFKLVFMSDRDGNWDIYTMNADGTDQVNVTNTDPWDGDPVWIPSAGCLEDIECDDGVFCNGIETCVDGSCEPGVDPCPGELCDEVTDTCAGCLEDIECDDGLFCNGIEICVDGSCEPGVNPCPGQSCDEATDACVGCLADTDCTDGLFCNGVETCVDGFCQPGSDPCPGELCDEVTDTCTGCSIVFQDEFSGTTIDTDKWDVSVVMNYDPDTPAPQYGSYGQDDALWFEIYQQNIARGQAITRRTFSEEENIVEVEVWQDEVSGWQDWPISLISHLGAFGYYNAGWHWTVQWIDSQGEHQLIYGFPLPAVTPWTKYKMKVQLDEGLLSWHLDLDDGEGYRLLHSTGDFSVPFNPPWMEADHFERVGLFCTDIGTTYYDNLVVSSCRITSCAEDADCDDGLFCNGAETCVDGFCQPDADPCPGQSCDEATDTCVGAMPAALDIKPESCPNGFNPRDRGSIPIALVGSFEFDVATVDLTTLRLSRADGVGGTVQPARFALEDVATPFAGEPCDCHEFGGDGVDDLWMKLDARTVVDLLELEGIDPGTSVVLVLTGNLLDGSEFNATDCLWRTPARPALGRP